MRLFAGIRTRPAVAGMVASLSAFWWLWLKWVPRVRPRGPSRNILPGRQLARASVPTGGGRLAGATSPTRPLPFDEAISPSATRPRDMRPSVIESPQPAPKKLVRWKCPLHDASEATSARLS